MRSSLTISLILLAVVLLGGLYMGGKAQAVSEEYAKAAESLYDLTDREQWQEAAEKLAAYQAKWEKDMERMQLQVVHDDTDDVTLALAAIEAGVRSKSKALCLWGCNELEESARHLYHRDKLSLGNVL